MHAPHDSVPFATSDLPAPATLAGAPPAGPPPGPDGPNQTSLGPNHAPHGVLAACELSGRVAVEAVVIKSSSESFLFKEEGETYSLSSELP
ncbi:hypothetical protein F511_11168 [Dorcoceras hygrometricum]|nr:hypothetical protein F511_11168 [Dorcoceras hygrometricum]